MQRFMQFFPLWAILLSTIAYFFPALFTPLKPGIVPLLMVIMFGMGITLTLNDFLRVLRQPGILLLGVALQYSIMPLAALLVARLLDLPTALLVGMVLLGSSPGGTASNVICYLARGNVALSVTLTLVSTLLAFILTPALTWLYVGHAVSVPVRDMLYSVLKIVVIPVLLGAAINTLVGNRLRRWLPFFPLLSVLAIIVIIAIIVAINQPRLAAVGYAITLAVVLHNLIGLLAGYWIPRLLGKDAVTSRTLAIEVGMQNSGLSVALAIKYFSSLAALPGALFSIWHNISGVLLASYWRRR
jgi:BASS family bile acid:Na+ symporter